ncbi:MAG TPA: DUF3048 domain-containing protein [Patescibacteria group bacterium]|nr:DUF3048 domain-containing protein [Patescibacteria group bacterium]
MDAKKKNLLIGGVIYIIAAVVSFFVFTNVLGTNGGGAGVTTPVALPSKGSDERVAFNAELPKTQVCPINGAKYSKQQEQWWQQHRPLGVMIENHEEARPQSGLSYADVVYEAVAEGGITRFLAIFYCQDAGIVGPVRSARTYFLDMVSEYGDYPLYAHVGGANTPGPADALGQIEQYGWQTYNDLNQFSIGFPTYWRDYERLGHTVATEHTMYSTTSKLWDVGKSRKLTNVDKDGNAWDTDFSQFEFKDDAQASARPTAQSISFDFWEGYDAYGVQWNYDKETNSYLRSNGGVKHIDKDTGKQLAAKNVVILFMRESHANDGYDNNQHMLYGTTGTGQALIFQDGKETKGSWSKKSRTSRIMIKDATGQQVKFTRGLIWFEIVGTGTPVVVK